MFESFIARRYLRSKQKEEMISVISVIAVAGIATGVMAMILALGITSGLSGALEQTFLEATGHVMILERTAGAGIEDWEQKAARLSEIEGVKSVEGVLYDTGYLRGPINSTGIQIKGILVGEENALPEMLRNLKEGSLEALHDPGAPGIILGSGIAKRLGAEVGIPVTLLIPNGRITPLGPREKVETIYVAGIFESGVYEFDNSWTYMELYTVQDLYSYGDVVNTIEIKLDDVYDAPRVAKQAEVALEDPDLKATTWQEQNQQLLNSFRLERRVATITISLIQIVAVLNILSVLVMMVMEKRRGVAILMSMGAKTAQIRKIFLWEGLMIGGTGTVLGLIAGYLLSYFADRGQWLQIDAEVYSLSYVPVNTSWVDGIWVAAFALLISFLAALYPANKAAKISPVESMRYE